MNDSFVYPLVILPLFLLLFIIARLLTTLFHELGHAIPGLVFTKGIVTVFLGSYGDVQGSIRLQSYRRIHIYFKFNPLKWKTGMVQFVPNTLTLGQHIFILLLGPFFSLILAIFSLYMVYSFDLNGFLRLFGIIFLLSAIFDLRNIFPSETPVITSDGSVTYNDGRQVVRLIQLNKEKKLLSSAYKFYAEQDYLAASPIFEKLNPKLMANDTLDMAFTTFHKNKDYGKAKKIYTLLFTSTDWKGFSSNNLCNIGVNESQLGDYDVALKYYNQSLELDNNNIYSLSNRGFNFNLTGRFDEGLADFDKVLTINENFAYAYSNRAYSKIKLGLIDVALVDINRAIEIDSKESYAYRSLGMYYLEKGNYIEALNNLKLAYDLDPHTFFINEYIELVQGKLKIGSTSN